jgi:hypothetical protein
LPPAEPGWVIVVQAGDRLALAKRGPMPDESFTIVGRFVELPAPLPPGALAPLVREQEAAAVDPKRFTLVAHDVSATRHLGVQCARSHMLVEDRAPVRQSARTEPMALELLSLTCVHPTDGKIGVNAAYSQRGYHDRRDPDFRDRGDKVLQSLEFIDLVQVRDPAVYCNVAGQPTWIYDRRKCD